MYVALGGPKGYEQVTVRETSRIPGTNKNKTRIIKNYGRLSECLEKDPAFLEKLKKEISKNRESKRLDKNISISLPTDTISNIEDQNACYHFGHMIVKRLWEMMKLDEYFDRVCTQKNKDEVKRAIYFLVAHRLGNPASIRETALEQKSHAGIAEVTMDVMYSVLDVLEKEKDSLIEHLSRFFAKNTTRDMSTVSYDVTNYYFESTDEGQLRLFGYSKEHKNNEVLVVMGLLIDSNGIPVTMQLFPGNTMDQNTLTDAVENLEQLYGMKNITVVADRGMNSGENLIFISDKSHHFVISYTLKKAKKEFKDLCLSGNWDTTVYDTSGNLEYAAKIIDHKIEAKIPLTEEEIEKIKKEREANKVKGRFPKYRNEEIKAKVHVTYNAKRAHKDQEDRNRAVKKLESRIAKPGFVEQSIHYGANKYLQIKTDSNTATINQGRIDDDAKWDGYYAVVTDKTELTTEQVMEIYRGQWKIEESFRILKTDLEARPVYVWKDNHIIGHFVMCYLALCIIRFLQYKLKIDIDEDAVLSADRIMSCISDPIVVIAGEYPNVVLQPTNLNADFLNLISFLKFKKLEKNMTPTRFRAITNLDLNKQLQMVV